MITHRIHLSRSPDAVRIEQQSESFVRETGRAAVELPEGSPSPAAANHQGNADAAAEAAAKHESAVAESMQAIFDEIRELEARRQQSIDELRELAVEIACAITTHVLDDALARNQFPLEKLVDQALKHLGGTAADDVVIKLHPGDCQEMERVANQLKQQGNQPRVKWQADPTLERGSCEAKLGERGVFVDIHDQLNQIRHELLGTLDHAQTERRDTAQGDRHVQRYPNRRDTA